MQSRLLTRAAALVVEYTEPAAGHEWKDVTTSETERGIRRNEFVGNPVRTIAVGINRPFWTIDWTVVFCLPIVRKRRSGHFVNADARAGEAAIETMEETRGVSGLRIFEDDGLFH